MHSFIEYLMYLPKEKQLFMPYLNRVDMFRNANLTLNTGYTCKMLKTMRSSLFVKRLWGMANWLYGRVSAHSINHAFNTFVILLYF